MGLTGFLGNQRIVRSLLANIAADHVSHAYMFVGPEGSGRKTLARAFASRLFCDGSCDECIDCRLLRENKHPDFQMFSSGYSVKLEHARELKQFLSLGPNRTRYKIGVLENCQHLTSEAANSLLKILEDPPGQTLVIMTADNPGEVLHTIRSRAIVHNLAPLPAHLIQQSLEARGVDNEKIPVLVGISNGLLGKALCFCEKPEYWDLRAQWAGDILGVLSGHLDPLSVSAQWCEHGQDVLDFAAIWLRDMLLAQVNGESNPVNLDLSDIINKCITKCPEEKTIMVLENFRMARQRLLANCNPSLTFDSLLLRLWEV